MVKRDNKNFIIETSFIFFLDKGYRNTSMSDLVNETKLSKGAFYHHFKNKEELYQEVINRYFISYYKEVNWDAMQELSVTEIENVIKEFYKSFIPEIVALTPKGMSRYFIIFFEAYDEYPLFKTEVRLFYDKLKSILIQQYKNENIDNPVYEATNLITKYEGLIFWLSVFPEQNIDDLLKKTNYS